MTAPSPAARAGRRRRPAGQVVERPSTRLTARRGPASTGRRRLAVVYDIEGPRVRLGIAWFAFAVAGIALGPVGVAAVYGLTAAVAGAQAARAWRRVRGRRRHKPNEAVAAAVAVGLPIAAAISTGMLGLAVLGAVATCLLTGGPTGGTRTLQCGIWPGAAAAAVVVSDRFEPWAAVALVLAVSAYEIGDYLVGSGARNALEGPVAGAAAALVVGSAAGLIAFGVPRCVWLAVLAAVLCPLGQLVASLVLPSADAKASALRRLDSLLVLGPVWAWIGGMAVQSGGS